MNYFARPGVKPDKSDWQLLKRHLKDVAERAKLFAMDALPDSAENKNWICSEAWWAGILHDLGKYRLEFQEYLAGQKLKSKETAHAVYGAAMAAFHLNANAPALAFAIAGHHAGLYDYSGQHGLDKLLQSNFKDSQTVSGKLIDLATSTNEIGVLPQYISLALADAEDAPSKRRFEFLTRFLFSLLVDADRLDAARWDAIVKNQIPPKSPAALDSAVLLQKLLLARDEEVKKNEGNSEKKLVQLRNQIFDHCLETGKKYPQGFFSLTVPTGGGKTLSSMAFALSHAKANALRRIIVVIPYLSIIEQNARTYRNIFGSDIVLEHHSAVEPEPREDDPQAASEMDKAVENWDAPVIVTTSVQFLETLFSSSPAKARKLHNIARIVVIFDEVQTLPTHMLDPILDVLRELKNNYGVSFLFCSATQPAFRKSPNLKNGFSESELIEVNPDPAASYKNLQRVRYQICEKSEKWNWRRLAEAMMRHQQVLCVVNLKRHASDAWEAVKRGMEEVGEEDGLFHLSSAMCPAHRLDLLGLSKNPPPDNIKIRLDGKKPCRVISTQLIEAGVDIDFPVVFRAMGPLDSIVQAAGRCNREGRLKDETGNDILGTVTIFQPEDSGLPRGIYETASGISASYLNPDALAIDPTIFSSYFHEIHQVTPTDHAKRGEQSIQQDRAGWNFRRVSERARVIKDNTTPVIVPYGKAADEIKKILEQRSFNQQSMRSLQRFMVSLRQRDFNQLLALQQIKPILPNLELYVLGEGFYDNNLGIMISKRPTGDYLQ